VAVTDLDEDAAKEAASEISGAFALRLDVSDRHEVRQAVDWVVEQAGALDVLVNNAGLQRIAPIVEFDEDDWSSIIDTMLTGTFLCTKYALPHLRRSSAGRVINIASVHGLVASPNKSAYVSAKHAVVGFTRCLALEEAMHSVTANAVCPGYIRTVLAESQVNDLAQERGISAAAALHDVLLGPTAIKRMLEPVEVAELVAYLASDVAGGITGSAIPIDCGWTAQ
jgi:3-hydroxybutyrate dehydrogenase